MSTSKMFYGDCRDVLDGGSDALTTVLRRDGIDMILTDPPYGVAFKSTYGKNPEDREKYQRAIHDDDTPELAIEVFDEALTRFVDYLNDPCELYIFSDWTVADAWIPYLRGLDERFGIKLARQLIWDKGYPGIGDVKANWGLGYETIFYLKKGRRPVPYRRSAVIAVDKVRPGTNVHPTQKPVELLKILIEYSTAPGQVIFDPFAGSGSTLVAAKEVGRHAYGIERERDYFDAACNRLAEGGLLDL